MKKRWLKAKGKAFSSADEVRIAFDNEQVDLHARIRVRMDG